MELPPIINTDKPHQVCRLTKSLYGLKQASKQWYDKLNTYLYTINFNQSKVDDSLFVKKTKTSFIAILVYVNDILITRNNINDINEVKSSLNSIFKIKDLGQLKFFLGLEIARTKSGIHICQRKYALEILSDAGMLSVKPVSTSMIKKNKNLFIQNAPMHDRNTYRRVIERLLYLVNTRPDINFPI